MRLRVEAGVGLGLLLVLQLLVSAWAIGLLLRMSPAVGEIVDENGVSLEAVEQMLTAVALDRGGDHAAFDAALATAAANVTEPEEPALIERIGVQRDAARKGSPTARAELVGALNALGEVNRASMRRADRRARRLGQAGAWTAAILGVGSFALGLLVFRRLRLRLELPVEAIRDTLERVRNGDPHRRCHPLDAPVELRQIATDVNLLLDRRHAATTAAHPEPAWLRPALLALLDREPRPTALLTADGALLAANPAALAHPELGHPSWAREPLPGTDLSLARPN